MKTEGSFDASDGTPKVRDADDYVSKLGLSDRELATLIHVLQRRQEHSKQNATPQAESVAAPGERARTLAEFTGTEKLGLFGLPAGFASALSQEFATRVNKVVTTRQWDTNKAFEYDKLQAIIENTANEVVEEARSRFPSYSGLFDLEDVSSVRVTNADIANFARTPQGRVDALYEKFPEGCTVVDDDSGKQVLRIGWEQVVNSELFAVLNHAQSTYHRIVTRNSPNISVTEIAAMLGGSPLSKVPRVGSQDVLISWLKAGVEQGALAPRR